MKKEDERTDIQKKVDAHFLLGNIVHIKLLEHHWKRGTIEKIDKEFFVLNERVEGIVPVFFKDVVDVSAFIPMKKEVKD